MVLSVAISGLLGFWLIPDVPAVMFVSRTGFWFVLGAFVIFGHALWRSFRAEILAWRWREMDGVSWVVIGLGGAVLLVHETFGFKIVMDEIMLLGASMSMHFDKTAVVPMRSSRAPLCVWSKIGRVCQRSCRACPQGLIPLSPSSALGISSATRSSLRRHSVRKVYLP
jgi:hypothetical protein